MKINGQIRCDYCFEIMDESGVCPGCGKTISELSQNLRCLKPGTRLAQRYIVGSSIGEGGFGITYTAWDTRLDLCVAVKEYYPADMVCRQTGEQDPTVVLLDPGLEQEYLQHLERFQQEAKTLSRFSQCQGIVSVRDYFPENHTAYLVMDFIQGQTLKKYVHVQGRIQGSKVLRMMKPVLCSLQQIHDTGLLHRDISPDNILVDQQEHLVLVDFGSARRDNAAMTRSMTVVFKQGYSPEEQYRARGKQGAWSDIYSLCATMYYMLTGSTPVDAIERVLEDDLPQLTSMEHIALSMQQKQAIQIGMAVNAKERYQSIAALYQGLYGEAAEPGGQTEHRAAGEPCGRTEYRAAGEPGGQTECSAAGELGGRTEYRVAGEPGGQIEDRDRETARTKIPGSRDLEAVLPQEHSHRLRWVLVVLTVVVCIGVTVGYIATTWVHSGSDSVWDAYSTQSPVSAMTGEPTDSDSQTDGDGQTDSDNQADSGDGDRTGITESVSVPLFCGKMRSTAQKLAQKEKLKVKWVRRYSQKKKGVVLRQSIKKGEKITPGTTITLTISKGTKPAGTPTPKISSQPDRTSSPQVTQKPSSGGFDGTIS